MCRDMCGWCVATTIEPRGHVEIDYTKDEMSYQYEGMSPVLPITETESVFCSCEYLQVDVFKDIFLLNIVVKGERIMIKDAFHY